MFQIKSDLRLHKIQVKYVALNGQLELAMTGNGKWPIGRYGQSELYSLYFSLITL